MHEPRLALDDHVVSRGLAERSRLPIACHTRVDETRIDLTAVIPPQAQLCELARDEVLYQHVGLGDEFLYDRKAIGVLEVDRKRPLVAVRAKKIGRFSGLVRGWR